MGARMLRIATLADKLAAQTLAKARKLRIFHGFGAPDISWRGQALNVPREAVVDLK